MTLKCPYRNFENCIGMCCPACNYETEERKVIKGKKFRDWSEEYALERGTMYEAVEINYKFISCKLVDNNVAPQPANKQEITNTIRQNVIVNKSIF